MKWMLPEVTVVAMYHELKQTPRRLMLLGASFLQADSMKVRFPNQQLLAAGAAALSPSTWSSNNKALWCSG